MIVLITGASAGFGEAMARKFVANGHRVIAAARRTERLARLHDELGERLLPITMDVTDRASVESALAQLPADWKPIDVLVNNAGIVVPADIESATLEEYRLLGAIHGEGTFLGCKYGIQAMKANPGGPSGSIINISSLSAVRGFPGVITYAAAKGAVLAMTTTIAAHMREKGYGMRCNAILPGMINTPLLKAVGADTLPGLGQPEDVANTVLFLASDESRHMSGAHIVLDNASSIIGGGA